MLDLERIHASIDKEYVIEMRRHFHMYPETSRNEVKTKAKICSELDALGIPYKEIGETGVVGTLGNGKAPIIGLRGDMDALPLTEVSQQPFCSKNEGVMHACGHDFHMAMLLGAAKALKGFENEIEGTIRLIFQPAEEVMYGAKDMLATGYLDDVEAMFGMHVWSDVPMGQIGLIEGPVMAAVDVFKIKVKGLSAHGATPHKGIDALMIGSQILTNLQTIISREMPPQETVVITAGKFHGGTAFNIVADEAIIEGTVRYFNRELLKDIRSKMEKKAKFIAESFGGTAEVEYQVGLPPVENDADMIPFAKECAIKSGLEPVYSQPVTLSEDFSLLADGKKGVFGFIGFGKENEKQLLHTRNLNIDEDILSYGSKLHTIFAIEYLNRKRGK